MHLIRELAIAFVMAIVAAEFLELIKPGRITRGLVWMISRLVPREIRKDRYSDWCAEAEGIRADPEREGPFAAARFALGQVPFAIHLLKATRQMEKVRPADYIPWWKNFLMILAIPGIPFPMIPFTAAVGVKHLGVGDTSLGLAMLGVAAWQAAGAWYILWMARSQRIPITLSHKKRSAVARSR